MHFRPNTWERALCGSESLLHTDSWGFLVTCRRCLARRAAVTKRRVAN